MKLSEATIKEFQNICRDEYGQDLNLKEAHQSAYALVGFYDCLLNGFHELKNKQTYDNNNN